MQYDNDNNNNNNDDDDDNDNNNNNNITQLIQLIAGDVHTLEIVPWLTNAFCATFDEQSC